MLKTRSMRRQDGCPKPFASATACPRLVVQNLLGQPSQGRTRRCASTWWERLAQPPALRTQSGWTSPSAATCRITSAASCTCLSPSTRNGTLLAASFSAQNTTTTSIARAVAATRGKSIASAARLCQRPSVTGLSGATTVRRPWLLHGRPQRVFGRSRRASAQTWAGTRSTIRLLARRQQSTWLSWTSRPNPRALKRGLTGATTSATTRTALRRSGWTPTP
mmetsp:Transcript_57809/g.134627  ORF Transcript_57809/g.134627 Transcript_57809/m.134627 type:complete len:221 (-) Transcript_57809:558-1220(-)